MPEGSRVCLCLETDRRQSRVSDIFKYSFIVLQMHTATADVILTSLPHCLTVSFTSGLSSTVGETWCQTQALLAVRGSQAFTSPTANVPGVSP